MPDQPLQNHYCVAVLQHRLSYNVTMGTPEGMRTFKATRDQEGGDRGIFVARILMSSNFRLPRVAAIAFALMCAVCLAACSKPAVTSLGCPSSANIASAAGTSFGAPKVVRTGVSLSCSYPRG